MHIYTCTYSVYTRDLQVSAQIYMYIILHVYICTYINLHRPIYKYIYIRLFIYAYVYVYIIYTYMYIHTHTYRYDEGPATQRANPQALA